MYKKDLPEDVREEMKKKLLECAALNRRLDEIMQDVKDTTDLYQEED